MQFSDQIGDYERILSLVGTQDAEFYECILIGIPRPAEQTRDSQFSSQIEDLRKIGARLAGPPRSGKNATDFQ